ncbi:glycosyltransferase family 4 protein [Vibrio sp.]|nr:glycosyltransferase family 4 protein [Vibrio sp.]
MKIALAHYRVGETDGVSLEMDKWALILENMGHEVVYIAGSQGTCPRTTHIIEELAILYPEDESLRMEMYLHQNQPEDVLQVRSERLKQSVSKKLIDLIQQENIQILVPNNILCMGRSIPIGEAFCEAITQTGVTVINHHHDFYWERAFFSGSHYAFVQRSLDFHFPPKGDNIHHCVINTLAKNDLLNKKNIPSTYVPNVFDFHQPCWEKDNYNQDLRSRLGIQDKDVFFLQGTRLVARKGVELAIDVIVELEKMKSSLIGKTLYNGKVFEADSRLVYAMVGLHEDHANYVDLIREKCEQSGIDFIIDPTLIDHERTIKDGEKVYSLWDAYVDCDFVMYPSIYEGWGNQLLEAMFAKKPTLVFEYSVYEKDIQPIGCDFVSLGNTYTVTHNQLATVDERITKRCAQDILSILFDAKQYQRMTNKNFELGKQHFSYHSLHHLLSSVFPS